MSSSSWYQALSPARSPGYHTLHKCFDALQKIRALLNGLSEARRRKIQIASQRGTCFSLQDLELELDRLENDYRDLCRLYEQSSPFQRYFPSKQFQADITTLEDHVKAFYSDVWKTTAPGDRAINWGLF